MKFEGNIPSYLRTGAGSFAVSDKKLANVEKTENLFEKVKFGKIKIRISKKYKLVDARDAHADLEARKLIGPAILIP